MQLIRQLNKPIQRLLLTAEVTAGETAVVGVNIQVEADRVFLFHGLLAEISLGDATDVGTGNNLVVRGQQGKELTDGITTIAQAAGSPGSTFFNTDVFFPLRSISAPHYFGTSQRHYNQGIYSFFLGFVADPALLPFAGNALCALTIFGEVVSRNNDEQFPLRYR